MLKTYIYKELSHVCAERKGTAYIGKDLSDAKRYVSRQQKFQNTIMRIEDTNGNWLSYKDNGKWIHCNNEI